jgi:hypothetical protein
MEDKMITETSVNIHQTIWCHIPDDSAQVRA